MIYRNVTSLVVRVMAAETLHDIRSQSWQGRIDSGTTRRKGSGLSREEMKIYDCWMHARLRSALASEHWQVLTARYSSYLEHKVAALHSLQERVVSPAPEPFRERCVVTWGFPETKGALAQRRSILVLPAAWYDMANWSDQDVSPRTRQRWARQIRLVLDAWVNEALIQVQALCEAEGVFEDDAA